MSLISTHFFHQVPIFFLLCTALLLRLDSKPTVNSRTYQLALVLDCEQSLFSQSSLSSAELERAKWLRGKLERGRKKLSRLLPSFPLASLFFSLASLDFLARVTTLRDCFLSTLGLDEEKKIWTIIFTTYFWGVQKTINISIEWRANINYGLKWLGNEVKDWVVSPGEAIKVLFTNDNMKEWFMLKAKGAIRSEEQGVIIIITIIMKL